MRRRVSTWRFAAELYGIEHGDLRKCAGFAHIWMNLGSHPPYPLDRHERPTSPAARAVTEATAITLPADTVALALTVARYRSPTPDRRPAESTSGGTLPVPWAPSSRTICGPPISAKR